LKEGAAAGMMHRLGDSLPAADVRIGVDVY
jgi:hypothetical protein